MNKQVIISIMAAVMLLGSCPIWADTALQNTKGRIIGSELKVAFLY